MNRFFRIPFAFSGDRATVPEPTQVDGTVSYESGYGPDYQAEQGVDPDAKNIERDKMNDLFFDVTTALREYQVFGRPDFITTAQNGGAPYGYSQYAQVKWTDGKVYESLVNANTADPTDPTKWKEVQNFVLADNIATLAEAQAGTDNTKIMTALRVAQAVPAASEPTAGRARVATQAQTNAGTDDGTIVTPKKLRFGFAASFADVGYITFPSWLGGLILQWGTGTADVNPNPFSISFPTACYIVSVTTRSGHLEAIGVTSKSQGSFTTAQFNWNDPYYFFAIGK